MGNVVTLPAQRPRRRQSVQTTDEATILLFMGVRYVRDFESSPLGQPSQPPVRQRDEVPLKLA